MKNIKKVPFSQVPKGAKFFLDFTLYKRNDFGEGLGAYYGLHFTQWTDIDPNAICRIGK